MPLYEHVYLARQDVSQQQVDAMTAEFKQLIEEGGGSIGKTEYWGVKSLTYKIKKKSTKDKILAAFGVKKQMKVMFFFHELLLQK